MPDLFFKGISLNRIFFISGLAIIIVLITIVLILIFTGNPRENVITDTSENTQKSGLTISDFYLDNELQQFFEKKIYPYRDHASGWSKEEVNKFFIPVDEILYEYFKKNNDNYIKEIFDSVE